MDQNNKQLSKFFLKKTVDYKRILKSRTRAYAQDWLVLNYAPSSASNFRLGITIPAQTAPAVTRNRLKRWCREFARNYLKGRKIASLDVNLFLKKKDKSFYKLMTYEQFSKALLEGLRKIENK